MSSASNSLKSLGVSIFADWELSPFMPNAKYEFPYDGAKEMLLVDDIDNKEFLTGLFNSMYDELPVPKPKKKK